MAAKAKKPAAKKPVAKKKTAPKKKAAAKKQPAPKKKLKPAAKKKPAPAPAVVVDVDARLAALPAITETRPPDQPVSVLIAAAARALGLTSEVRAQLEKLYGFDLRFLLETESYIARLNANELAWIRARAGTSAGTDPKLIAESEALKTDLLAAARYFFRNDPVTMRQLDLIMEGTGAADLAGDLRALAGLISKAPAAFASDETLPPDVEAKTNALAAALDVGTSPVDATAAQAARNRAFWLVDEANDELRAALQNIWRKQPARLALLGASYATARQRVLREKKKEETTEKAPVTPEKPGQTPK